MSPICHMFVITSKLFIALGNNVHVFFQSLKNLLALICLNNIDFFFCSKFNYLK